MVRYGSSLTQRGGRSTFSSLFLRRFRVHLGLSPYGLHCVLAFCFMIAARGTILTVTPPFFGQSARHVKGLL